ncbi:unnamed protein product [Effrenium voratum]|uniref:peptidyl-tRNA hydrolase n=1 Tax=Effrenium voratum TaxID=2562239 RepID=A0AA36IV56_9DINO|nr:unnamed protein product [Effrenium voratum]
MVRAFGAVLLAVRLASCSVRMDCKLAVVARSDLRMSAGKLAAQVGHAVHDAVTECPKGKLEAWEEDGSMIVVLQVDSEAALAGLTAAAKSARLQTSDVRDEGRPSRMRLGPCWRLARMPRPRWIQ